MYVCVCVYGFEVWLIWKHSVHAGATWGVASCPENFFSNSWQLWPDKGDIPALRNNENSVRSIFGFPLVKVHDRERVSWFFRD